MKNGGKDFDFEKSSVAGPGSVARTGDETGLVELILKAEEFVSIAVMDFLPASMSDWTTGRITLITLITLMTLNSSHKCCDY